MQLGRHARELWDHRRGLAAAILLASFVSLWSVCSISLTPPSIEPRALEIASATTRVLVDTPRSLVLDLSVQSGDIEAITDRALLVSNVMASAPVRGHIARRAGVPLAELKVASPITRDWPRPLAQSGEKRSTRDILRAPEEYRLNLRTNPTVPVIDLYAQAPTAELAERLADGAITGMRDYLRRVAADQSIPGAHQIRLEQLGRAEGEVINDGVNLTVAALVFLLVFAAACAAVLFSARARTGWRLQASAEATRLGQHPRGPATG